jgi:hypothetical protein
MRRHHDMGGLDAGPVETEELAHHPWEKQTTAILRLLCQRDPPLMTIDEMRRNIEDLGPGTYDELSYYGRWINAISRVMLEKGVVSVDELGAKMAEVEHRLNTAAATKP